jgi:four helix bundle protein
MSLSSYRELKVWQHGIELSETVYRSTAEFPKQEVYGLTSQMRPAVVSIPSNIAEGHSRESTKEYLHHLSFTLGSLAELETQITIAERLKYLAGRDAVRLVERCDHLGRMLRNLQRSLRLKLRRDHGDADDKA